MGLRSACVTGSLNTVSMQRAGCETERDSLQESYALPARRIDSSRDNPVLRENEGSPLPRYLST